jgi:hypothetical protein
MLRSLPQKRAPRNLPFPQSRPSSHTQSLAAAHAEICFHRGCCYDKVVFNSPVHSWHALCDVSTYDSSALTAEYPAETAAPAIINWNPMLGMVGEEADSR